MKSPRVLASNLATIIICIIFVSFCNIVSAETEKSCPLDFLANKRVFLIGDSIIKQMFKFIECVTEYYEYIPQAVDKKLLKATGKFRIKSGPYSFLIGNFMNATPMATELFYQHPSKSDILVALFGAHSSLEHKEDLRSFFKDVYYSIAKRFPGPVFWMEPLPQVQFTIKMFSNCISF